MAGAMDWRLAAAVCAAGGLGSVPCAMLSEDQIEHAAAQIRAVTRRSFNLNFFCHETRVDSAAESAWRQRLAPYYRELEIASDAVATAARREPFGEAACGLVERLRPRVVSFHFGLPDAHLVARVKLAGAVVLSSATTVEEAFDLERRGVDAVIAQGSEAGGHRGMFLTQDVSAQIGTMALVPQIVDAVSVPVIAAGGIADGRAIAAALALGATAVQIGTAYLLSDEATIAAPHRAALLQHASDATVITNVMTGRPARGLANRVMRELGPMSDAAPPFPTAASPLAPLRATAEAVGSGDFSPMWAGQAARLARCGGAGNLTRAMWQDAQRVLATLRPPLTPT